MPEISTDGAELQRLSDAAGRDYLWDGDPAGFEGALDEKPGVVRIARRFGNSALAGRRPGTLLTKGEGLPKSAPASSATWKE